MAGLKALGRVCMVVGGVAAGFCGMELLFGEVGQMSAGQAAWWAWSLGLWGGVGGMVAGGWALRRAERDEEGWGRLR